MLHTFRPSIDIFFSLFISVLKTLFAAVTVYDILPFTDASSAGLLDGSSLIHIGKPDLGTNAITLPATAEFKTNK